MIEVSVHIVTYKRKSLLVNLVHSLKKQDFDNDLYEICVCDSFSDDGTESEIRFLQSIYSNIKYYNIHINTAGAKRNYLLSITKSQIIISLDDDVLVDTGFLQAHYNAHKNTRMRIFCGNIRFPESWIVNSNYYKFRDSKHKDVNVTGLKCRYLLPRNIVTMNMSFKREEIINVGFMDEEFTRYGGEDIEFGFRITSMGFKIEFLNDARALHLEDSNLEAYLYKLYVASRTSTNMMLRKAPGVIKGSKTEILLQIENNRSRQKILKILISLILNRLYYNIIMKYLVKSDKISILYSQLLFSYVCAYSIRKGIQDRNLVESKNSWLLK